MPRDILDSFPVPPHPSAYQGGFRQQVEEDLGMTLTITRKATGQKTFVVFPVRWIGERGRTDGGTETGG